METLLGFYKRCAALLQIDPKDVLSIPYLQPSDANGEVLTTSNISADTGIERHLCRGEDGSLFFVKIPCERLPEEPSPTNEYLNEMAWERSQDIAK